MTPREDWRPNVASPALGGGKFEDVHAWLWRQNDSGCEGALSVYRNLEQVGLSVRPQDTQSYGSDLLSTTVPAISKLDPGVAVRGGPLDE